MSRLTVELARLTDLASDRIAWQEYAEQKAKDLAKDEPEEFAELPRMLRQEVDKLKQGPPRSLRPSIQVQSNTGERNDFQRP